VITRDATARLRFWTLGLLCLAAAVALPAGADARVPIGFFGTTPQTSLSPRDYQRMGSLGLTMRIPVFWFSVEPRQGVYEFDQLDATIAAAAEAGVRVMPFVYGTPAWLADEAAVPPLRGRASRAWRRFVARLVRRYGANGSFWEGRPSALRIRAWQIWNEPNFPIFWKHPSPAAYVHLLRGTAATIRRLDSTAQVVAAGVAPVEDGMYPWTFLRRMYQVRGAARTFDLAALHPYSTSIPMLDYEIRHVRLAMAAAGDAGKPLLISEVGVASDGPRPNPFDKGAQGQARFLRGAYRLLLSKRRRWRLAGAYWFTWQDLPGSDPYCIFCSYAGLFDVNGKPKPAWWAFRRVAEARVR
jgi:hypothetical protein